MTRGGLRNYGLKLCLIHYFPPQSYFSAGGDRKRFGLLLWFIKYISDLHALSPFKGEINEATAQITLQASHSTCPHELTHNSSLI